jgi:putative protein-disulfide isomerase
MPTFVYIFDPYCGWCFGFSPVLQQLKEEYGDRLKFEIWAGGMITDDRVGPVSHMASYILDAYKVVEEHTGVAFGKPYLDLLREGTDIADSAYPARALACVRMLAPGKSVDFGHALQNLYFQEGKSLTDPASYPPLLQSFGLEQALFDRLMESEEMSKLVEAEFAEVSRLGITGFPTTLIATEENTYLLSRGFAPHSNMEEAVEKVLAMS